MIEIPVYNMEGKQLGSEKLDPASLGGRVRTHLLKQAVVTYRANRRQGTVTTKSRGMVHGASRKLYRQKGTGRARAGNLRTPVRVGGGHTFAKINRDFTMKFSRQMRRMARNSAILAKAQSGTTLILQGLQFDAPKTAKLAAALEATKTERGALIAVACLEPNLAKSGRNIQRLAMKDVGTLNAYDVLRARHLIFTPEAFAALNSELSKQADEPAKPAKPAKTTKTIKTIKTR